MRSLSGPVLLLRVGIKPFRACHRDQAIQAKESNSEPPFRDCLGSTAPLGEAR
jgi:hypothetical protein